MAYITIRSLKCINKVRLSMSTKTIKHYENFHQLKVRSNRSYQRFYYNLVNSVLSFAVFEILTWATVTVWSTLSSAGGLYTTEANTNRRNPHIFSIINQSIIRTPIVPLSYTQHEPCVPHVSCHIVHVLSIIAPSNIGPGVVPVIIKLKVLKMYTFWEVYYCWTYA
jgi:hypothetical protein